VASASSVESRRSVRYEESHTCAFGLTHVIDEAAADQFIAAANAFRMQKMGMHRRVLRNGTILGANNFQARRQAKLSRRQHQYNVRT
jgi:hypothetical protein